MENGSKSHIKIIQSISSCIHSYACNFASIFNIILAIKELTSMYCLEILSGGSEKYTEIKNVWFGLNSVTYKQQIKVLSVSSEKLQILVTIWIFILLQLKIIYIDSSGIFSFQCIMFSDNRLGDGSLVAILVDVTFHSNMDS